AIDYFVLPVFGASLGAVILLVEDLSYLASTSLMHFSFSAPVFESHAALAAFSSGLIALPLGLAGAVVAGGVVAPCATWAVLLVSVAKAGIARALSAAIQNSLARVLLIIHSFFSEVAYCPTGFPATGLPLSFFHIRAACRSRRPGSWKAVGRSPRAARRSSRGCRRQRPVELRPPPNTLHPQASKPHATPFLGARGARTPRIPPSR